MFFLVFYLNKNKLIGFFLKTNINSKFIRTESFVVENGFTKYIVNNL
jgi:hypothetical protein